MNCKEIDNFNYNQNKKSHFHSFFRGFTFPGCSQTIFRIHFFLFFLRHKKEFALRIQFNEKPRKPLHFEARTENNGQVSLESTQVLSTHSVNVVVNVHYNLTQLSHCFGNSFCSNSTRLVLLFRYEWQQQRHQQHQLHWCLDTLNT